MGRMVANLVGPGYAPGQRSPIASSPLAQTPSTMPSYYHYPASSSTKPIAVPQGQLLPSPPRFESPPPTSIPSPTSSASLDGPIAHRPPASPPSSHRPARRSSASHSHSHSLAGSYTLSLLSSRMSHAHPARSVSSAFRLQIGCSSGGRDVPANLRCPDHIRVGFDATCYDLDDGLGGASGAVSTPWVGCVDLQAHYHAAIETERQQTVPPPRYPGYQVPAHGLLQLVIANAHHALRVFLVPYDLAALEPGGRMLVRERGYQAVATPPNQMGSPQTDRRTSFGSPRAPAEAKREVLRFAVEMQFACVLEECPRKPRKDEASAERRRLRERSTQRESARNGRDTPSQRPRPTAEQIKRSKPKLVRAYYLTKAVRMVFPSVGEPQGPPAMGKTGPPSPTGRSTPTPRLDAPIRTERFVEVINPSTDEVDLGPDPQRKARRTSFAAETWEGLRAEWRRRLLEDAGRAEVVDGSESEGAPQCSRSEEGERGGLRDSASPEQRRPSAQRSSRPQAFTPRDDTRQRDEHPAFPTERIQIQPRPLQASSLLSARLGSLTRGSSAGRSLTPIPASDDLSGPATRAGSPIARVQRDPYEGLDADGVPLPAVHAGAEDEYTRLQRLSEQLQQLSSPTRAEHEGLAG